MIERVLQHPAGQFRQCGTCGREPRHIFSRGFSTRDTLTALNGDPSDRHMLECRCGKHTQRRARLASAVIEWDSLHAQLAMPVRCDVDLGVHA